MVSAIAQERQMVEQTERIMGTDVSSASRRRPRGRSKRPHCNGHLLCLAPARSSDDSLGSMQKANSAT